MASSPAHGQQSVGMRSFSTSRRLCQSAFILARWVMQTWLPKAPAQRSNYGTLSRLAEIFCIVSFTSDSTPQAQAFIFGSVPLQTFLPDGDIDLSIFTSAHHLRDSWAASLYACLKREAEQWPHPAARFQVADLMVINAEVSRKYHLLISQRPSPSLECIRRQQICKSSGSMLPVRNSKPSHEPCTTAVRCFVRVGTQLWGMQANQIQVIRTHISKSLHNHRSE